MKEIKKETLGAAGLTVGVLLLPITPWVGLALVSMCTYMLISSIVLYSKFAPLWKGLSLERNGMEPELREKRKTGYSLIYRFSVPPGLGLEDFERNKQRIQTFVGKEVKISEHAKNIIIEVYDGKLEHFDYELIQTKGIEIPLGKKRNGEYLILDMAADEPHLLIAGEPGSGKSVLLRGIITSLIQKNVALHLVDLKGGTEFRVFERSRKVTSFGRTAHEALTILQNIQTEVERRYNLFYDADAVNINDFNKRSQNKLKPEVLIVDEYAELMGEKESQSLIQSICARARACSIYVILSTQRPDRNVIDGLIKCNITNTVGLKCHNRINSEVIIDEGGLEFLAGSGHGIFKAGGKKVEFQAPFLSADDAKELVKATYINKPKRSEKIIDFGALC